MGQCKSPFDGDQFSSGNRRARVKLAIIVVVLVWSAQATRCPRCWKTFPTQAWCEHTRRVCNDVISKRRQRNLEYGRFVCLPCGTCCNSQFQLKNHTCKKRTHFPCDVCGITCNSEKNLVTHCQGKRHLQKTGQWVPKRKRNAANL